MGSFTGANNDSISSLNKEIEINEQELQKIKQEQTQEITRHHTKIQELKDDYEDQIKRMQ